MSQRLFQLSNLVLGALVSCWSCTPKPELRSYLVNLLVEREPGVPSPGIRLETGGKLLAKTDAAGRAHIEMRGFEGGTVPVNVQCPADCEPLQPFNARLLTLAQGSAPTLHAICAPKTRRLAVVLRAALGNDLPVVHHSKTLGVTDADGVAHVLLEGEPGESFELTLDTSTRPELRPQNPGVVFAIASEDSVTSYDSAFTVKAAEPVHRWHASPPKGPVRIH